MSVSFPSASGKFGSSAALSTAFQTVSDMGGRGTEKEREREEEGRESVGE